MTSTMVQRSWGSSPRMRGTPAAKRMAELSKGIIPAYAGNTLVDGLMQEGVRDHPRVCGEHSHGTLHSLNLVGSSPRMRGTLAGVTGTTLVNGIIPAYAGNTNRRYGSAETQRDHPRVCGEHVVERKSRRGFKGSSPRMRGTPVTPLSKIPFTGIIPAYAGNTQGFG